MKLSRAAWTLPIVLLLAGIALVAFLPARWIAPSWQARLHGRVLLDDVGGTAWRGHAGDVVLVGGKGRIALGRVDWQLSPLALFHRVDLQLALAGPPVRFAGHLRTLDAQTLAWGGIELHGDLAVLDAYGIAPGGDPLRGMLDVRDGQLQLRGGWPQSGDVAVDWRDAGLVDHGRRIALGNLRAHVQAVDGVVQIASQDDGSGALRVDGHAMLSPLGWRYDISLAPRRHDAALSRWLAHFGPLAADGSLHLRGSGGIAAVDGKTTDKGRQP